MAEVIVTEEPEPTAPATSAETTALAMEVGATNEKAAQAAQKAEEATAAATTAVAAAVTAAESASQPPPPPPAPDVDAIADKVLEKLSALAPPPIPEPPAPEPKPADEPPASRKNRVGKRKGIAARYYGR